MECIDEGTEAKDHVGNKGSGQLFLVPKPEFFLLNLTYIVGLSENK